MCSYVAALRFVGLGVLMYSRAQVFFQGSTRGVQPATSLHHPRWLCVGWQPQPAVGMVGESCCGPGVWSRLL